MRMYLAATGLALLCSASAAHAQKRTAFGSQSKAKTANVQILAVSSSSRQSFAGNQEIYLADVQMGNDGDHVFARLIDQYPGYGLGIQGSVLKDRLPLKMKVTRELECDVPGSQVFLDQRDAAVFDGSVRRSLLEKQGESIPCFRSIHGTIKIQKP